MKDKPITAIEQQLNKFLQAKCLIPGGLGLWEDYFRKICTAWGEISGEIRPQHIIFSADNGCNMEGYVGYNYEVTQKQSRNMLLGRSSATQFCDFNNIPYEVVDVGIASDDGYERVEHYVKQGINLFSFGEMGLGNTTTSACVLSALTGADPTETVGPGSWPNKPDLMKRKIDFVRAVLDKHKASIVSDSEAERVRKIVAHIGGFDIAAILGAMLACVEFKKPFVIDGFITSVAAACAVHINDCVKDYALPSHNSREKGTELALAEVDITQEMVPIQAQMSMGEGTGAILMVQMLKTTQHMFVNVGTFADLMKL